jgi:hypothetical protein
MSRNCASNIILHSSNHHDFLDDTDNGKDLDDIDFEELNKIGEGWAAGENRGPE